MRLSCLLHLALAATPFCGSAATQQKSLEILQFDAVMAVQQDGSVRVEEQIEVRFTGSWNGIYRTIPTGGRSSLGVDIDVRLTPIGVTDAQGTPVTHWVTRRGDEVEFKIAVPGASNADREVRLAYRLDNLVRSYHGELEEIYWNVTGDQWPSGIREASCRLGYPETLAPPETAAFVGARGSREAGRIEAGTGEVTFIAPRPLRRGEGLTIVAGFPAGSFQLPSFSTRTGWVLADNWHLALAPLLLLGVALIWWFRGRDNLTGHAVVVRWDPPDDLSPAEIGVLADDQLHPRDITATILDLAMRGYVKIEEHVEGKYQLVRLKEPDQLEGHERVLMEELFREGDTYQMRRTDKGLSDAVTPMRTRVEGVLVRNGYFRGSPSEVRTVGTMLTIVPFAALILLGMVLSLPALYFILCIVCGVAGVFFARQMPQRTRKGLRALAEVKGLEEYIGRAETENLKERSVDHFEKLLPYAVALDLEDNWSELFEGIYERAPSWYEPRDGGLFTMAYLHGFASRSRTAQSYRPVSSGTGGGWSGGSGFGGGGFSGGGSGGGGGGGW